MKIVHTEASCGWGGQEIRILTESKGMMNRGHEVMILAPSIAPILQHAKKMGIPHQALSMEKKRFTQLFAVRKWLKNNPVDVVNTHSSTDSWLVAIARWGLNIPLVRTRHISAPLSTNRTTRWLYLIGSDHVATTGELLRQDIIQRLQGNPRHFTSVPTGIDLKYYHQAQAKNGREVRAEIGIPEDALVIGIASTLRSWKGHQYLLDAFQILADNNPRLHLLLVGGGPMEHHIDDIIATSSVGRRIHRVGQRDDVPDMLAAMDIFTLPSYANEGVPQAILQAMAMQLPVVSTHVGAIAEAVQDAKTGYMIEPKKTQQLVDKLQLLIDDPATCKLFGMTGRAWVEERFSLDNMLDAMQKIFDDVQ